MVEIIRGAVTKSVASSTILDKLFQKQSFDGILFLGYPIIGVGVCIDALFVSPDYAVIAFDLVDDTPENDRSVDRDAIYTALYSSFISNRELSERRELLLSINVLTFAPALREIPENENPKEFFTDESNLQFVITNLPKWDHPEKYQTLLSAIQVATRIKTQVKRTIVNQSSKGAKLSIIEKGISTLDAEQNRAVIETNDGPQRIRGLAGSGKTIILALKAAYLHAMYPQMRIAITFNTRSLKPMFEALITKFVWEYTKEEPDYSYLHILPSWGSPSQPGVYSEICLHNGFDYYDLNRAKKVCTYQGDRFDYICKIALQEASDKKINSLFDIILVDEAQDLPLSFLQLCLRALGEEKRIVLAYDELQRLNKAKAVDIKTLFGSEQLLENVEGKAKRDLILPRCYRNCRQVLITAHSLGFGIYREEKMVQFFDDIKLWQDVGYESVGSPIAHGQQVTLSRTTISSPAFLEENLRVAGEIVECKQFATQQEELDWVASEIIKNIEEEELKPEDIMVIYPDPVSVEENVGSLRSVLFSRGYKNHIAGVTTSTNSFLQEGSITFTGIYRAKGNEAAMVYILDSQYCAAGNDLRTKRNILFTAITRSKGWVRIYGYGEFMGVLVREFNILKTHNYQLHFRYPTIEELKELDKVYSNESKISQKQFTGGLESLLEMLKKNEITIDAIPKGIREELSLFFNGNDDDRE